MPSKGQILKFDAKLGVLVESKRDRQNLDPAPTVLRLSSLFRLPWHVPSVLTQITNRTLDIQPYQFRPKFALSNSFARPNETRILTKFSAVIKFEYFPRSYSLLCDVIYSQVSRVDTPIESHAHFIKCLCVLPVRACLRPHYIVLFTPGTPRYTDLCTSVLAPRRESLADDFATKPRSEPPELSS